MLIKVQLWIIVKFVVPAEFERVRLKRKEKQSIGKLIVCTGEKKRKKAFLSHGAHQEQQPRALLQEVLRG